MTTAGGNSPKTKSIKTSSIKKKILDQSVIRRKSVEFDRESKVKTTEPRSDIKITLKQDNKHQKAYETQISAWDYQSS